MKVALLNKAQIIRLKNKELAPGWFFNPIIDDNGNLIITEDEIAGIKNPDFNDIKLLTTVEHSEILTPPDFTPPKSDGVGIVVANAWRSAFNWPLTLNGFEIGLKFNGTQYYIERSVFDWPEFRKELAKPQNDDWRALLIPLFNYLKNTATKISV